MPLTNVPSALNEGQDHSEKKNLNQLFTGVLNQENTVKEFLSAVQRADAWNQPMIEANIQFLLKNGFITPNTLNTYKPKVEKGVEKHRYSRGELVIKMNPEAKEIYTQARQYVQSYLIAKGGPRPEWQGDNNTVREYAEQLINALDVQINPEYKHRFCNLIVSLLINLSEHSLDGARLLNSQWAQIGKELYIMGSDTFSDILQNRSFDSNYEPIVLPPIKDPSKVYAVTTPDPRYDTYRSVLYDASTGTYFKINSDGGCRIMPNSELKGLIPGNTMPDQGYIFDPAKKGFPIE